MMDKNIIKKYLIEASATETPAIKLKNKIDKEEKKINTAGIKEIGKDVADSEKVVKQTKADEKTMAVNKFNYSSDDEKEYHEQMEILNGQEMIQYDRTPDKLYKERAIEAIEGSSKMGNNPEWANVVAKGQGGDPEFGKNLVKTIKASAKKRSNSTPTSKMYGDDWEIVKDESHKAYAFENRNTGKNVIKEGKIDKTYTHFAIHKPTGKIVTGWEYKGLDKEDVTYYTKMDLKDWFPDNKLSEFKISTKSFLTKSGMNPFDTNNWGNPNTPEVETATTQEESTDLSKNKTNNTRIKENMKRLKFKKEFGGVGNALKLIPESYKIDNKVFEITDGNENYQIRWEGTVNEGTAVILKASDKNLISEDIKRMKALFNYKSADTLGIVKGKERISEDKTFTDIWNKTKKLMLESEDIDGQDAEKEAPFEEAGITQATEAKKDIEGTTSTDKGTQAPAPKNGNLEDAVSSAPEAKKHIEGSASTDKGTQAPNPKNGKWDEISVPQASEAKKHITMNEEVEDDEADEPEPQRKDAYDASLDVASPEDMGGPSKKDIASTPIPSIDDEGDDELAPSAPAAPEVVYKHVISKTDGKHYIMIKSGSKVDTVHMPDNYISMFKEKGGEFTLNKIKMDKRSTDMSDTEIMEALNRMLTKN